MEEHYLAKKKLWKSISFTKNISMKQKVVVNCYIGYGTIEVVTVKNKDLIGHIQQV